MRHNIYFKTPEPGPSLTVDAVFDDETGLLTGDAGPLLDWAEEALEEGHILCPVIGGSIPATDPLHVTAEICALVGIDVLPDSLKPFYPTQDYPGFRALPPAGHLGVLTH